MRRATFKGGFRVRGRGIRVCQQQKVESVGSEGSGVRASAVLQKASGGCNASPPLTHVQKINRVAWSLVCRGFFCHSGYMNDASLGSSGPSGAQGHVPAAV